MKHKVILRVADPGLPVNNTMYLDNYNTGLVDASDFYMLQKLVPGSEGGNIDKDYKKPTIVQAAFLGRMICERFATPAYETVKAMPGANYSIYHQKGIQRECEIIKEMCNLPSNAFKNTRAEQKWDNSEKEICGYVYRYPAKDDPRDLNSVTIEVLCDGRPPASEKWTRVLGATLLLHTWAIATPGTYGH